uniref:THAP-type domain-containing protein n=1 Tax=Strigamia maritima TaxID=126957 RepID=T1IRB0_STRMM
MFNLHCTHPDVMKLKEPVLKLGPKQKAIVAIYFPVLELPGPSEVLLFIDSENGKNEDIYKIQIIYDSTLPSKVRSARHRINEYLSRRANHLWLPLSSRNRMVRTCFVPRCKSGYKTCKEKWSLFNTPKDPEQRKMWKKLIGRKDRDLDYGDYVCERHFPPEQIIRHWIKRDNDDRIICKVDLKQCRLAEGALPTIFPKGENTPKKQLGKRIKPPRKPPKIRDHIVTTKKRKLTSEKAKIGEIHKKKTGKKQKFVFWTRKKRKNEKNTKNCFFDDGKPKKVNIELNNTGKKAQTNLFHVVNSKNVKNDAKNSEKNTKIHLFDDEESKILEQNPLLNISLNFKPVGTNWRTVYDKSRGVLSVYWPEMRKNGLLYMGKQIVVAKDLSYKIYFLKKAISGDDCVLDGDNVIDDLIGVVEDVNSIRFCAGGPEEEEFLNSAVEFASVDESGVWRHRECRVQCLGEEDCCAFCKGLRSAIDFYLSKRSYFLLQISLTLIMAKKCYVPGCSSGYNYQDGIYLFQGPQDEDLLQKWRGAIPKADRELTQDDNICSKHFEPHFIVKEWSSECNGYILMPSQANLADGAVPSIFPDSKQITLLELSFQFKPNGVDWKTKYDSKRELLSVYLVGMTKTGLAYVQKQIVVAKDLSYQVYFLRRKMNTEECFLDPDNAVDDLKYVINDVDSIRLCIGGPDQREFSGVNPRIAFVDESGVWRHKECTGECIKPAFICPFCKRVENTLKSFASRKKQRRKKKLRVQEAVVCEDEEYDSDRTVLLCDSS